MYLFTLWVIEVYRTALCENENETRWLGSLEDSMDGRFRRVLNTYKHQMRWIAE